MRLDPDGSKTRRNLRCSHVHLDGRDLSRQKVDQMTERCLSRRRSSREARMTPDAVRHGHSQVSTRGTARSCSESRKTLQELIVPDDVGGVATLAETESPAFLELGREHADVSLGPCFHWSEAGDLRHRHDDVRG